MIGNRLIGKCVARSGRGPVDVLFRHLPGGTDKYHEILSQDGLCPGRESNKTPSEQKCGVLPLHQPAGGADVFNLQHKEHSSSLCEM
jgi:hypothetical protein